MPPFANFRSAYLAQPRSALLAFDFDGTLAPIVATPSQAELDKPLYRPLKALGEITNVAIISGRPTDYLKTRFSGLQVEVIGNYGRSENLSEAYQALLCALVDRAHRELPASIFVELKPSSIALHYRNAPERESMTILWAQAQERDYHLSLDYGKSVVELAVGDSSDKGKVLRQLARGRTAVLYAGDDFGDIPAVEALKQLPMVTCSIAVLSEQTPAELSNIADERMTRVELANCLISLMSYGQSVETEQLPHL